jgi:hypothetical protein
MWRSAGRYRPQAFEKARGRNGNCHSSPGVSPFGVCHN